MPITSEHPEYQKAFPKWVKCRDAVAGEEAIKEKATLYLPSLSGCTAGEYEAYKQRALFYGATGRTVDGMTGAVFMKDPVVESTGLEYKLSDLDKYVKGADSFITLARKSVKELSTVSRAGFLVDADITGENPYICMYPAENITNWEDEMIEGDLVPTRIILKEVKYIPDPEDITGLEKLLEVNYRELYLTYDPDIDDFVYQGRVWVPIEDKGKKSTTEFMPTEEYTPKKLGGRTFNRIPFVYMNAVGNSSSVDKPVILDLVNVNLSHYRTSADLEHGRHFTALPTPWAAGFDAQAELKIGSTTAWVTTDPQASCGFLEFRGDGLGSLSSALGEKAKQMAVLGARLLEEQKLDAESAETVRLRQSGESGILTSISRSVSEALTLALSYVFDWLGEDAKVSVLLNMDYFIPTPNPQLFNIMFQAYQAGSASWETWFYLLKKHDMVPPGVNSSEEKQRIENNPMFSPEALVANGVQQFDETIDDF